MIVCPDSHPDADRDCWTHLEPPKDADLNVMAWIKAEMLDGLDHEVAHTVTGPAIWGLDENGVPKYHVHRDENGVWTASAKPGYKSAELKGLFYG